MAEQRELIRRVEDLASRCEKNGQTTHTHFLTPAEQYWIQQWAPHHTPCRLVCTCGVPNCERNVAYFLSPWTEEEPDVSQDLTALEITAGFGTPGHRDYLGAILGLGIDREWCGDILLKDNVATIICFKSVAFTIQSELTHVGRFGVKIKEIPLSEVSPRVLKVKEVTFTVQSLRLDAVASSLFGLSRTAVAKLIRGGLVQLNYDLCEKPDAAVDAGDVLSIRGYGKAILREIGGESRKGRTYCIGERYL